MAVHTLIKLSGCRECVFLGFWGYYCLGEKGRLGDFGLRDLEFRRLGFKASGLRGQGQGLKGFWASEL